MGMHILCISNDEMLMRTRELLLRGEGYQVTSCWGYVEGASQCRRETAFDLLILCQSVAPADRDALIATYRANHRTPIIALLYHEDIKPRDVILHQSREGPAALLATARKTLQTTPAVVADA
jgi:DNA-binding response OmpR family regulator